MPSQAWALYNELNQHSPNLSLEVALNAIQREDVLPNSMIFDLLYNNPDILRDEHIFNALEQRTNPITDAMINILRSRADVRTMRSLLEEEMSDHFSAAMENLNDVVIHYLADSTNTTETDSLITHFLKAGKHTLYLADALRYNLHRGHLTDASAILNTIGEDEWSNETTEQLGYSVSYYNNILQWQSDSVLLSALDSSKIELLENIAGNNNDYGGIEAMNILNFFYGYNYFFDVPDVEAEPSGERKDESLPNISTLYRFNASPNPAGEYSTISWVPFSVPTGNTVLHIYDVTGVEVQQHEINTKTGQYLLDTSQLVNGLYLIQLQTPYKFLQAKLNVQH